MIIVAVTVGDDDNDDRHHYDDVDDDGDDEDDDADDDDEDGDGDDYDDDDDDLHERAPASKWGFPFFPNRGSASSGSDGGIKRGATPFTPQLARPPPPVLWRAPPRREEGIESCAGAGLGAASEWY